MGRVSPFLAALLAALLFGAAAPVSKLLLGDFPTFQLAGLLYLGAGLAMLPAGVRHGAARAQGQRLRVALAIASGGVVAPLLLLQALRGASAGTVSLWLNLELVATALLGWCCFRDHLGRTGAAGLLIALLAGGLLSATEPSAGWQAGLLVAGACIGWGFDNNLTAVIAGMRPTQLTMWKGLIAGTVNFSVGVALAPLSASAGRIFLALALGAVCYGASLVLYITASHHLGASRTQVVFASAPFFGVAFAVALGEPFATQHALGALLMLAAVALMLADQHHHLHRHEAVTHIHLHRHDDGHHDHPHLDTVLASEHLHWHTHEALAHAHTHWPDLHHRHSHPRRHDAQPAPPSKK
jgi:drug/metabolite transporter (DMT)-like permease